MIEDQLDRVAAEELDEDLREMAKNGLFAATALLAIQQTRILKSIDNGIRWICQEGLTTWEGRNE